jgi:hypothetical protein
VIAASNFSRKNGKDSCIGTVKTFNYNHEFNYNLTMTRIESFVEFASTNKQINVKRI